METPYLAPMLLDTYADLFINRRDCYMTRGAAGSWVCCRETLPDALLAKAIAGRAVLGLYSVDRVGCSKWLCLDLDDNARGDLLSRVIAQLDDPSSALLEASRRGFHLWVFVEPAPWFAAQRFGHLLARNAGLAGIEVFPKGPGLNGVRAPLSRHIKDGQVYPLIDPASGEIAAEPWALLASRRRMPVPELPVERPSRPLRREAGSADHRALVKEVERYTRLRFYGPEKAIGRCPFHEDRHPSFGVMGGFWRCFAGCGEGGLNAFRARIDGRGPRR